VVDEQRSIIQGSFLQKNRAGIDFVGINPTGINNAKCSGNLAVII
jgi:hypothetical protein